MEIESLCRQYPTPPTSANREKPMSFLFQPMHVFVAVLTEYVRKQQEMVVEYLQVENWVLREQVWRQSSLTYRGSAAPAGASLDPLASPELRTWISPAFKSTTN